MESLQNLLLSLGGEGVSRLQESLCGGWKGTEALLTFVSGGLGRKD